MKKLLTVVLLCLFTINVSATENLAQNSKSAILMDYGTGEILFENNAHEKLSPASMTKIASLILVMEALEEGRIKLDDKVTISENAASMGGSQLFLEAGEVYTVDELLKGVAISSANDAITALAEKVSGTVGEFVKSMNEKCSELGCKNSNFINPHGLDEESHYSTSYDMALLSRELLKYDKIIEYTSIYEEYLTRNDGSKTWLVNTNKLVRFYPGVDGLKTGYTSEAGYCLSASAMKNNLRLISVVMGVETSEKRSSDTVELLEYGFNTYKSTLIKDSEESIGEIKISNGKKDIVEVYLKEDLTELQKVTENNKTYEFNIKIDEIKAPISSGEIVGEAEVIDSEGNIIDTVDLIVKEDIKEASFLDLLLKNLEILLSGKKTVKN